MSTAEDKVGATGPANPMPMVLPELLDTGQVAHYLGLRRTQVAELARQGKLPGLKVGRQWRFLADDLRTWIRKHPQRQDALAKRFDELWDTLRQRAEAAGYGPDDVPRLIEEVRRARRERQVRVA